MSEDAKTEVGTTDDEGDFDPIQMFMTWVNRKKILIAELEAKNRDLEADKGKLEAEIADKASEIETLTAGNAALNEDKTTLETKMPELEAKIEEQTSQINELEEETRRLVGENSILSQTIRELQIDKEEIGSKLAAVSADLKPVIERLEENRKRAQDEAMRLKEENLGPAERVFSLRNKRKFTIQKLIDEQKRVIERIRIEIQEYETDPDFWKEEIEVSKKQEARVESLIKSFEEVFTKAKEVSERKEEEIREIKGRIGRWNELTEAFQARIEDLLKLSDASGEKESHDYPVGAVADYSAGSPSLH
ncbi:MAG: hypothetical protein V1792_02610 [Pseudomonadota bacterium]